MDKESARDSFADWLKETVPDWVVPYLGSPGLTGPGSGRPAVLGSTVRGVDYWQINHFVAYRPETAAYLYGAYTPVKVEYRPGAFPRLESLVAPIMRRNVSARETAMSILNELIPRHLPHPSVPPCGPQAAKDRGLDDNALLASGAGWCNEQARIFVRFCQIAGIPARLAYLFYADGTTGHAVSEFFVEGHWVFADSSWLCVATLPDGRLLSTAECHNDPEARRCAREAYHRRYREILAWSDTQMGEHNNPGVRQSVQERLDGNDKEFGTFGILNYPLPS